MKPLLRPDDSCLPFLFMAMLTLAGCGGLQDMWEGPAAQSFKAKSIAILPPDVGIYDGAREEVQEILVAVLSKDGRYDKVLPHEQVIDTFQTNKEAFDALVALNAKLQTTGQPDKEAAQKIGKALGADALLVVRVNAWEYVRKEGDNLAKIGLGLRLIDTSNGALIWRARHERASSYMFFRPPLKDVARDLAEEMARHLPRKDKK
jgi:hypothetical protein